MGYKSINSPYSNTAVLELFKEGRCAMNLELSRNGKLTPQQLRKQLQQGETSDLRRGAVLLACRWSVWDA
jgi:hypothetical protein